MDTTELVKAIKIFCKRLNTRLKTIHTRYLKNRLTRYIVLDNCNYEFVKCFMFNNKWCPYYEFNIVLKEKINNLIQKQVSKAVVLNGNYYYFKNPIDQKILSNLFNWNYLLSEDEIILDTVEFNRKNLSLNLNENECDYSYDAYDAYSTECIGSSYGCPELTNGTQLCCKLYCPYMEDIEMVD